MMPLESVIKFIKNLPALPSHYCRKETSRLYLPVEFRNLKNVYRVYKEDRTSQSLSSAKIYLEIHIFNKEFNPLIRNVNDILKKNIFLVS